MCIDGTRSLKASKDAGFYLRLFGIVSKTFDFVEKSLGSIRLSRTTVKLFALCSQRAGTSHLRSLSWVALVRLS